MGAGTAEDVCGGVFDEFLKIVVVGESNINYLIDYCGF